jgi:zinc/manganese transport system substrate-binding protein
MKKLSALATFAVLLAAPALAQVAAQPVSIVAAENFYGDIAKQIGGPDVKVTSILSNPDQDPHLFEVSPSVGRDVSAARIVIYNGIDYDPWMEKLLGSARSTKRETIVVADLVGKKTGDNPHIWYDPATMVALAKTLSEALTADDPGHKAGYEHRLARFEDSVKPIQAKAAELRQRLAGMPVTATEPVFGYMFDALGDPGQGGAGRSRSSSRSGRRRRVGAAPAGRDLKRRAAAFAAGPDANRPSAAAAP